MSWDRPVSRLPATRVDETLLLIDTGVKWGISMRSTCTAFGRRAAGAELGREARAAAALELVAEVEQMMLDLKQELDVADATLDETWR